MADEHYSSEAMSDSDEMLVSTFGFGFDDSLARAVVTFNRYLADLSPEHQRIAPYHGPHMVDKSRRQLEADLEWEGLARPSTFELGVSFPCPPFVKGVRRVTLSRNDALDLRLIAEGVVADDTEFSERRAAERAVPIGSFIEPFEFNFEAPGAECFLKTHLDSVPDLEITVGQPTRFTQRGHPIRFRRRFKTRFAFEDAKDVPDLVPLGSPKWRSDWFINGPHAFHFTGRTERPGSATFKRDRTIGGVTIADCPTLNDGFDHFVVETETVRFAVSKVPDGYAPSWANAFSIDYAFPIPEEDVRDAIAEIVSFVLGRRMIPVGSSLFDEAGWTLEQEMVSPWGQGVQRICAQPDKPPVPLREPSSDAQQVLVHLVPRYLNMRKHLQLNDALLAYWLADEAYTAVDLVVYASAVEALKNAWLALSGLERGKYMPKAEFDEQFADQLANFKARVRQLNLPEAMANKIDGAWSTTGGEELRTFLTSIKIEVGSAEKRAMQQRNLPAHGGIKVGTDFRKLTKHAHAYRVLFVRVFLKMLGYDGAYVDRTTLGHPSRKIAEPAGGAAEKDSEK